MSAEIPYQLGSHAARLENVEKRVESIDGKLDTVIRHIEMQKGERKGIIRTVSVIAGTISAVVTAFLMKMFHLGGS